MRYLAVDTTRRGRCFKLEFIGAHPVCVTCVKPNLELQPAASTELGNATTILRVVDDLSDHSCLLATSSCRLAPLVVQPVQLRHQSLHKQTLIA